MRGRGSAWLQAALLCALGLLAFLPAVPRRDLWNPDEPRYAEVAREMRVLDDWLVPHLNGEIYSEKPPLFFWLSALLQEAGLGFASGRYVSAAAVVGTMLLLWSLARRRLAGGTAALAPIVLLTTGLMAWIGRMGVLDPLLTFCTTLAVYGLLRHREEGGRWIALLYVGVALGILTKGPVTLVIVLLAVLAAWLARLPARSRRPAHLLWGVALMLGIIAAWLVPACISGGKEYTDTILFRQTVGRVHQSWSHQRPFWYYLPTLPLFLFPWIFFVPRACVWAWKRGREEPVLRFLVLWAGLGLLAFSLISGKRDRYLLPLYPAVALLVAAYLEQAFAATRRGERHGALRRLLRGQHVVLGLIGLGFFGFALAGSGLLDRFAAERPYIREAALPLTAWPGSAGLIGSGLALVILALLGITGAARRPPGRSLLLVVLGTFGLWLSFDLFWTPRVNVFKSPRAVAQGLNALVPEEEGEAALFPADFAGAYNLYSGRLRLPVLETREEVERFLKAAGRRAVLTSLEHFDEQNRFEGRSLSEVLAVRHWVREVDRVGHRIMLVLTNFDPGAAR